MGRPHLAIVASLSLSTCGSVQPTGAEVAADPYVGRTMYPNAAYVYACPKPGAEVYDMSCPTASGAITIVRIERRRGLSYYFVTATNGAQGFVHPLEVQSRLQTEDPEQIERQRKAKAVAAKAACDRRGGVAIGMTRGQVYDSCWGKPRSVNTTITRGRQSEQLVYGGGYIYLDNGVVTAIQTRQ